MSQSMDREQKTSKESEATTTLPFWRQLRGTLIVSLILFAVIPVLVTLTIILRQIDVQMRQQVEQQLESAAELKIDQIELWIDNSQTFLSLILANPATENQIFSLITSVSNHELSDEQLQQHPISELLHKELIAQTTFEEFFIYTRRGQVIASSDADQIGGFVTNEHYFLDSLKAQTIQSPYFELGRDELTMLVTLPLVDPTTSKTVGVMAGRLSLDTLGEIMTERTGLGDTGETYLVSLDNNYLVTPSRFEAEGYTLKQRYRSAGIDRALNGENGTDTYLDYRDPGVPVIGVYRWLPQLQVAMLAEVDEAEALFLFDQVQNLSSIPIGVTILIAIGIGLYVAARISQPITTLTQVATRISQGDFHQQANVNRRNEIGMLATAFNTMTRQLRELIDSLEERVADRTRRLEIVATLGERLSSILSLEELLPDVVNQIKENFGYYYAHIYLFDENRENLVVAEGIGEAGAEMKARGHSIRIDAPTSLVARAARNKEIVRVDNVREAEDWLPNPLLPDTYSEMAVPIVSEGEVVGVLDVQEDKIGGLDESDANLLRSLSNQVAVAIRNARFFEETQSAFKEVERLNRRLTHQAWEESVQEVTTPGYRFIGGSTGNQISPASDAWLSAMKQAAIKQQLIKQTYPGNGDPPRAEMAVPLVLRGEVIGTLGVKREAIPDWSEDEMAAISSIANQITLALENARLSKEQEKTIVQLMEVDRLKSEFLTSMSHELRTPLNSIIGFADVLLQGIDGDLNDMAVNDIRLIHSSGQHLLALINDVLDLSKIEASKMELVCEPINVTTAIKDVLAASSSLVKNKPVEILVDVGPSLPPINADRLRFNQILLNLVSNAAKFTEKGSITLKAEMQESAPDKMLISVIDTGIGIPAEKIDAIFDRFRQADSSTTRQYGGTGLGLAICKQLIEMHGGEIWLESEVDVGSTFHFTIPLANVTTEDEMETAGVSN
jgi:signal transduction histidine kinase